MTKFRVLIGTVMSVLLVGFVMPVAYWLLATSIDRALGVPEGRIDQRAAYLLAGISWSLGAFWLFWAYSYLIYAGAGSPAEAFGIAFEPTQNLVTAGPYAYVRNPLVFGFLFILLGVGFVANSLSGIVLVPVVAVLSMVYLKLFEEKELARRFGVYYEHYRENVPMLIPRPNAYVPREAEA